MVLHHQVTLPGILAVSLQSLPFVDCLNLLHEGNIQLIPHDHWHCDFFNSRPFEPFKKCSKQYPISWVHQGYKWWVSFLLLGSLSLAIFRRFADIPDVTVSLLLIYSQWIAIPRLDIRGQESSWPLCIWYTRCCTTSGLVWCCDSCGGRILANLRASIPFWSVARSG